MQSKHSIWVWCFIVLSLSFGQSLRYRKPYHDPALKKISEQDKAREQAEKDTTAMIRARQDSLSKVKKEERKIMTVDFSSVRLPDGPGEFDQAFHLPPVRQYSTGTCWSFSTTSYLESEVYRQTHQKIKISEMFTVYHEYLEKVRRYVKERGNSNLGQGSEAEAVLRMWKMYGAVPEDAYPGVLRKDGLHDHSAMYQKLNVYLDWIKANDLWDEDLVLEHVKAILNETMGKPPETFEWQGKTYTPETFRDEVLHINLNDYVALMSTLRYPFYTYDEYAVHDNWWHSDHYYNVPLDDFYSVIKTAAKSGYTVCIGGDVSEPGIEGLSDAAIIPEFDIPWKYIDQDSREFRIYNRTTTDDHGIHLVGMTHKARHDWFLIKDSGSGGWRGKYDGYMFYRDDYIKLKMRTILVHKDIVEKVLPDFLGYPSDK